MNTFIYIALQVFVRFDRVETMITQTNPQILQDSRTPTCQLSLAVARKHGYAAGILYAYLQDQQKEFEPYGDIFNTRWGMKWIPTHSYARIQRELPMIASVGDAAS